MLVSSGTGFAPIWAVAYAALRENIDRRIAIVAGARTAESLFMTSALERTAHLRNVLAIPAVEQPPSRLPGVRIGHPSEHIPALTASDIVYAAGSPRMVDSVAEVAEASGVGAVAALGGACLRRSRPQALLGIP